MKENIMSKDASFQAKINSALSKEPALRDILDAMDAVIQSDKSPKQKADYLQRITDYGQQLSEMIYTGKRSLHPLDDNETIKEFNLRMQNSAYSKYDHEVMHGEPYHGQGYFDKSGKYVYVDHSSQKNRARIGNGGYAVRGGAANPRWRPIPLRETAVSPVNPTNPRDNITPTPVNPNAPVNPVRPNENMPGNNVAPIVNPTVVNAGKNNSPVQEGAASKPKEEEKRKKRKFPWLLVPVLFAAATVMTPTEREQHSTPEPLPVPPKDKTETVVEKPNPHLVYTVEKGKAMLTKQGIENSDAVYDNFVKNIDKMPKELKSLVDKYNMGTAKDEQRGINITDNPQVTATTLILLAESYPNIAPIIHEQIQNPGAEISDAQIKSINSRCKLAEHAHKTNGGEENGNHISTIDYGLYGASAKTGASVKFSSDEKVIEYGSLVNDVFKNNQSARY